MKTLTLLLVLLLSCGVTWGRAWDQGDCRALATIARATATYRENNVPLIEVRKALRFAADHPSPGRNVLRYDGDYLLIEALVLFTYRSTYSAEHTYRLVFTRCDRNGLSKTVKEVSYVD